MRTLFISAAIFAFGMHSAAYAELTFKPVPRPEGAGVFAFTVFLVIMLALGIWDGFQDKK